MQKYLFVCLANRYRSPWVAKWAREYCSKNGLEAEVKSAGFKIDDLPGVENTKTQLTRDLADWANTIFVMQEYMLDRLVKEYSQPNGKIVDLNIPDHFKPEWESNFLDSMTPKEASDFLAENYYHMRFGPKLLSRVLEYRLAPHLYEDHPQTNV